MLDLMTMLLGAPNERIWPGMARLPHADKVHLRQQPYSRLKQVRAACASARERWMVHHHTRAGGRWVVPTPHGVEGRNAICITQSITQSIKRRSSQSCQSRG